MRAPILAKASGKAAHGQSRGRCQYGVMVRDADILIVGGGLNGPALALALARAGFSVVIVDARAPGVRAGAGFDGRAYALSVASKRLLEAVGVWLLSNSSFACVSVEPTTFAHVVAKERRRRRCVEEPRVEV